MKKEGEKIGIQKMDMLLIHLKKSMMDIIIRGNQCQDEVLHQEGTWAFLYYWMFKRMSIIALDQSHMGSKYEEVIINKCFFY